MTGSSPAAEHRYDVIVVGGGPAGAGVAAWIARAGRQVALLDRARFPRDKACGEFLTPQTRALLCDLGVWEELAAAGLNPLQATLLHAPDGRQMRHTAPNGGPVGYSLRRVALDAALLANARAAGVEVHENFSVRGLLRAADGRVCGVSGIAPDGAPTALHAPLTIGADGTHSLVARQLDLVRPKPRLARLAVVTHWHGLDGPCDTIEMRAQGGIVCGLSGQKPLAVGGCSLPAPGSASLGSLPPETRYREYAGANITLVAPTERAAEIAGRAGDWAEETLQRQFPDIAARLAGARREPTVRTVGCFGHVCRPPLADGALLVGDAATFIDPFTGEGVYFALRGAQLAAETALAALRAGDTSARGLLPYARARGELTRRYLLCDLVQAVVRTPALLNRVVRRLDRHPGAADLLLDVLGDLRPPAAALHPQLLWRLLAPSI